MSILSRIKQLSFSLPKSDAGFAVKFIEERRFVDLYDLVHSCIIRIKKNPDKYPTCVLSDIQKLEAEVVIYLGYLDEDISSEDESTGDNNSVEESYEEEY